MGNMSYCRFENTVGDLRDCWSNWDLDEDASNYEIKAKINMIELIKEMAENIDLDEIKELEEQLENYKK